MARQTMTLLQNTGNILPLSKKIHKVAVIGPNADDERTDVGQLQRYAHQHRHHPRRHQTETSASAIVSMQGCDIVEDKITQSYLQQCSYQGRRGIAATHWNNREQTGDAIATAQYTEPISLTTAGQHEFAKGVLLKAFQPNIRPFTMPRPPKT